MPPVVLKVYSFITVMAMLLGNFAATVSSTVAASAVILVMAMLLGNFAATVLGTVAANAVITLLAPPPMAA